MWVAYTVNDYVTRLRASDRTELGTFAVGGLDHRSGGVAFDGSSIWVTNADTDTVTKIAR
jgi:hypothetical protein